jgi:hypothetical protein
MSDSQKYFRVNLKHPEGDVRRFVRDGALAQRIHRENPGLYAELRADSKALGLLGETVREKNQRLYGPKAAPTLSEVQQQALVEFDKATCEQYFSRSTSGNANNAATLKREDPARYELLRTAAKLHGVLPESAGVEVRSARPQRPQRESKPEEETRFPLIESIAVAAGLKPGRLVTHQEFNELVIGLNLKNLRQSAQTSAPAAPAQPASQQPPAQPPRTPPAPAQADAGDEN